MSYTGHCMDDIHEQVDRLMYASYKANRLRSPEVSPERWGLIFPSVEEMEERFQKEFQPGGEA